MEDFTFERNRGTVALITGGTQGLGLAIARRLVREGARSIVVSGRNEARGEDAAAQIVAMGADARFIRADVSQVEDCLQLIAKSLEAFPNLNALVNSAASTSRGSLVDSSLEVWQENYDTNVRGPFLLMQALTRSLLERGAPGSVVNILSISAHCGQSFLAPYASSKAALAVLTRNAANAHRRDRIRFNGIMTGWMDTPGETATQKAFHGAGDDWLAKAEAAQPMGQLVKPEQLAVLATYMLSPESGVMTGSLVDYDQQVVGSFPE
jgi:NAD(P)-dependent dehydrogenase (short-subunit alcohol dehydrogenase family)